MKLKDLSKEELMLILKKITDDSFIAQFKVRAMLSCLKEAEHCDRKWEECMQRLGCE